MFFNANPPQHHEQVLKQFILKLPHDPILLNHVLKIADQQIHDLKMLEKAEKKASVEEVKDVKEAVLEGKVGRKKVNRRKERR